MKVIVHYPKSEEGMKELERRVAECCAEAAINRIQNLTCSAGQKVRLLDAIIKAEAIEPTEEEVEKAVAEEAERAGRDFRFWAGYRSSAAAPRRWGRNRP